MPRQKQLQQGSSTPEWLQDFLQNQEERLQALVTAITTNNSNQNAKAQTSDPRPKLQNVARPSKLLKLSSLYQIKKLPILDQIITWPPSIGLSNCNLSLFDLGKNLQENESKDYNILQY